MTVSCGSLASTAMAGHLGHTRVAFTPTTSASLVVPSTRQATAVVGTPSLSAAWLIRVYVARKTYCKDNFRSEGQRDFFEIAMIRTAYKIKKPFGLIYFIMVGREGLEPPTFSV